MIQKLSPAHTYATELLVEPSYHEKRQWVRQAVDAFQVFVEEECCPDLYSAGPEETVRGWLFRQADFWTQRTDAGRAFVERVKAEAK